MLRAFLLDEFRVAELFNKPIFKNEGAGDGTREGSIVDLNVYCVYIVNFI